MKLRNVTHYIKFYKTCNVDNIDISFYDMVPTFSRIMPLSVNDMYDYTHILYHFNYFISFHCSLKSMNTFRYGA